MQTRANSATHIAHAEQRRLIADAQTHNICYDDRKQAQDLGHS